MSESTRGWLYRAAVLALIFYIAIFRPDHFADWVPIIIGLGASALASRNTRVR